MTLLSQLKCKTWFLCTFHNIECPSCTFLVQSKLLVFNYYQYFQKCRGKNFRASCEESGTFPMGFLCTINMLCGLLGFQVNLISNTQKKKKKKKLKDCQKRFESGLLNILIQLSFMLRVKISDLLAVIARVSLKFKLLLVQKN